MIPVGKKSRQTQSLLAERFINGVSRDPIGPFHGGGRYCWLPANGVENNLRADDLALLSAALPDSLVELNLGRMSLSCAVAHPVPAVSALMCVCLIPSKC